jgi:hypothetical protein
MVDKIDLGTSGYILGILSIILAVFQPLAGIVTGIVGFVLSKKEKGAISKKAKKLNLIGIIVGMILLAVTLIIAYSGILTNLQNFPTQ